MPQGMRQHRESEDDNLPCMYPTASEMAKDDKDRDYRDDAASTLFKEAGGHQLMHASGQLHRALVAQADKLEKFHSTPFSKENVRTILTTMEAIERVESQLERWHHLIYPNQKSDD